MKFLLMCLLLSISSASYSQAKGPKDIFVKLVKEAGKIIADSEGQEDRVHYLSTEAGLRNRFFDLQALAQSFTERYPVMDEIYRKSKSIEDQIGAYRQKLEALEGAISDGANQNLIDRLKRNLERAHERLTSYLNARKWLVKEQPNLKNFLKILNNIEWGTGKEEKKYIMRKLAKRLEYIEKTRYNMMELEGMGIHTLRKDARWYVKETRIFGGFNIIKLVKSGGKISNGACLISSKLHSEMTDLVSHFGDIKDLGEKLHAQGKELPIKYHYEADKRYKRLSNAGDQIFKQLKNEYISCYKDL